MEILLGGRETLVGRQRALVGGRALEVFGDVAGDGGGDRRRHGLGDRLAGDDALDGGGAEGAIPGGMAECVADAGDADALGDLGCSARRHRLTSRSVSCEPSFACCATAAS
jgi:hypothetical protein